MIIMHQLAWLLPVKSPNNFIAEVPSNPLLISPFKCLYRMQRTYHPECGDVAVGRLLAELAHLKDVSLGDLTNVVLDTTRPNHSLVRVDVLHSTLL